MASFSFRLANATAAFAAATGSCEMATAVGPVNRSPSGSNRVPFSASRASRFLVTLKAAPASRISWRKSLVSATVSPRGWVTTNSTVSSNRWFKVATISSFLARSTDPLPYRSHGATTSPPSGRSVAPRADAWRHRSSWSARRMPGAGAIRRRLGKPSTLARRTRQAPITLATSTLTPGPMVELIDTRLI
jgi:hypothetical protein